MFIHSTLAVLLSLITSVFAQGGGAQNATRTDEYIGKLRYCYELCKPCDESRIYNSLPIVRWSKDFDDMMQYSGASELPIYFSMNEKNKNAATAEVNDFVCSMARNTMMDLMSKRAGENMLTNYCHDYEEWAKQQRIKLGCQTCEQTNKKLAQNYYGRRTSRPVLPIDVSFIVK